MTRAARLGCALALASFAIAAAFVAVRTGASAHGDELDIEVAPLRPDSANPLRRLYRVVVVYENDREPVTGATVTLRVRRSVSGEVLGPFRLAELEGGEGVYVGEVVFTRFGSWEVDLNVAAAFAQGEGEVSFTDEVALANLSPNEEAQLTREAERVYRLQAFFAFDLWPDLVNITMRAAHSLAGVGYFAVSGAALLFAWTGVAEAPPAGFRRVLRMFGPVALVSLAFLLGAGVYEMFFDSPVVAPGIFDLAAMRRLPYGEWYLAAFVLKPVLFTVIAVLALRMRGELRALLGGHDLAPDARTTTLAALRRDSALNAAAGVAIVVVVATVIYLHYVSHLGVLLPE